MHKICVLPQHSVIPAKTGETLLTLLRREGLAPDAPCGGQGTCGKCTVQIDGKFLPACQVTVQSDLTVTIPPRQGLQILTPEKTKAVSKGPFSSAIDIGTTSVVCTLLGAEGTVIAVRSAANPQGVYGADVVSRIRSALDGNMDVQTRLIRDCVHALLEECCKECGIRPEQIETVCIVGNPPMQQLFLGISPENLTKIPFSPVLTSSSVSFCGDILPLCSDARLLTVPDISGYVGADSIGCILAHRLHVARTPTLLVDIGTNGEMVLAHNGSMIACATAAGPALEGANISCGTTAVPGAIDHVWLEDGVIRFSTIEEASAVGICGSGLIDAVAVLLETGVLNSRGRIQLNTEKDGQRVVFLTKDICLTQEDIRQVQLAKGAIRAGIELMVKTLDIRMSDISQCLLAGAFGTYLTPDSACRIGLLPPELTGRIFSVGNAALEGARMLSQDPELLQTADQIARETNFLELASLPEFPKTFARAMRF